MASHERQLLSVLEKIGQAGETPAQKAPEPSAKDTPTYIPISKKNFFVHHDTHPVIFDLVLMKQYEVEWFGWEASTLWKEIKEDFRVPSISNHAKAKIQAVKTLHINEWFWTKWEVFSWICQALNNNLPDFQVMEKPSIPQLFNAIDIATMVRPDEEFGPEVQMFVAACFIEEGVFYAPKPAEFCQDEIVTLLEHLKVPDFQETINGVRSRRGESDEGFEETTVDVQAAKLVVADRYLGLRRRQLKQQLELLV